MKKTLLCVFATVISLVVFAQKTEITFAKTVHDFGTFNESDGKVTVEFEFTNSGLSPLVISRVQASCGCTTPDWTKSPVEPGKKGSITVSYNPVGRPGGFNKSISVYSNALTERVNLSIKGTVNSSGNRAANELPVVMGDLRLRTKVLQMNNVYKGTVQNREVEIQNTGKTDMKVSVENLPSYLKATVTPDLLRPNEKGKISVVFNSAACSQWGLLNDDAYIIINGNKKHTDEFQLKVVSNVIEDFSKLTADQKRKAPIMELMDRNFNLGTLKAGGKKSIRIKISNKGVNPLEIRRVSNNNPELSVKPVRLTVNGGKDANLTVDLDSKNMTPGDYRKTIALQTNDPDKSSMVIVLSWKVQ